MAAEALVGGAFLSAFLNVLFDKMVSREVVDFFKSRKLSDGLLKKLNTTLISVNGVLDDAEEKQITKPAVEKWLHQLKDAVYEADDFLDEIAYEGLKLELEGAGNQANTGQLKCFLYSLNPLKKGKGKMEGKLVRILERLEYLVKQKEALGLIQGFGENPLSKKVPTTSMVDESGVYGRDYEKEAMIKLLLSDDDTSGKILGVIPIVGMGGVGKTTLAQLVYNDMRVEEWFDVKAWVCVSEENDVFDLIKDVLREVGWMSFDAKTANQLQLELKERLLGKKFLLVLDDVWSIKDADWEILQGALNFGAQGSKIVVTTRHESVASVMCTVPTHHLKELSDDDCWFLFAKHAFGDGNSSGCPDLELIGRKMVKKCRGLPLAAKALGCLLRSKRDAEEWEKVLKSSMWDLPNDNILPALRLSYYYLPSHLKRCFAYCAIFPKDYKFKEEALTRLWMAEGFLVHSKGNMEMEEVGGEYFHDLVSRSFFQRSSRDQSCFVMHDLINDLAKFVSREFCFILEDDNSCKIAKTTRHLSYARTKNDASKKFEGVHEARSLRTFLPLELSRQWDNRIDNEVMYDLLPMLRCLRVLSLSRYRCVTKLPDSIGNMKHLRYLNLSTASIQRLPDSVSNLYNLEILSLSRCNGLVALPDSIGNLKHLRYLNLSKTSITRFPDSMSSLYNLRTLILYKCEALVELPTNMRRLINLCHLDIRETKLQEMPSQMGKLTKLQTLTDFFLGKQSGSSINELGELQHLKGELCIRNLQNVVDHRDALGANLKSKTLLKALELQWVGDTDNSLHERVVLEQLQPHTNVAVLSIVGYGGIGFPGWMGDASFSNMVSLELTGCKYCSSLPPFGQLASLKSLFISKLDGVRTVDLEFYGSCMSMKKPFGSLEVLRFEKMPQWYEWISFEGGAFPQLKELYIRDCPNLVKALPSDLPSLTTLEIEGCQQLVASFPRAPVILKMMLEDNSRVFLLKKLSSGLHRLRVVKVNFLDSLLMRMERLGCYPTTLEEIEIKTCDSIRCFPLELFSKLKHLEIYRCPILQSLCACESAMSQLSFLSSLEIRECPSLASFPEGGLLAPNLSHFLLMDCLNLKSLPESMHSLLPSLSNLVIKKCPELQSFPEGSLPFKLESLEIQSCKKLMAGRMQWDLQNLPSLSHFKLGMYEDAESFPGKMLLPSSLTSLDIYNFQNLKSLDYEGLQHLTCLRELTISSCPKLQSMPEEGLPSSLSFMFISNCPLLKQRCQRDSGEDWPKISHIPHIKLWD